MLIDQVVLPPIVDKQTVQQNKLSSEETFPSSCSDCEIR